jgi:predicted nucleic acid-binding protein
MSSSLPRYVVDANVILRYLLRDDEGLAQKARLIWEAVEAGGAVAVCDPVTLGEAVFVMSSVYHVPNERIADLLISLVEPSGVVMAAKPRYLRALRLFAHAVSHFGDACACACALGECEGRLLSFERGLSAVDGVDRREGLSG